MKIFLLSLLLIASTVSATNYFVDVGSGNDSNNGTSTGTAWAHVPGSVGFTGSGWVTLGSGDKVIVKGGTQNNCSLHVGSGNFTGANAFDTIIIQSGDLFTPQWGTTSAIFDEQSTRLYGVGFDSANGVTLDGFEIRNIAPGFTPIGGNGSACVEQSGASYITIKRCWLHDSFWAGTFSTDRGHGIEMDHGTQFLIYYNHIGPNVQMKGIEFNTASLGAVSNNYFSGIYEHVIANTHGKWWDINNNVIRHDPPYGPEPSNAFSWGFATNCDIWNNLVFRDPSTYGSGQSQRAGEGLAMYDTDWSNRFVFNTFAYFGNQVQAGDSTCWALNSQGALGNFGDDWQNNICYSNWNNAINGGPAANSRGQQVMLWLGNLGDNRMKFNDFFFLNTTEQVMGYNNGSYNYFPVSTYNPVGVVFANNLQVDPKFVGGTLPSGLDVNYRPNTHYFDLTTATPSGVANTGNAISGDAIRGYSHNTHKFDLDIWGRTRVAQSMGASDTPPDPLITQQPADQSVMVGQTATFSVQAQGLTALTAQWFTNGVSTGAAGTSTNYTTPVTVSGDNGTTVYVVITDANGPATSATVHLFVTSGGTTPLITQQPASVSIVTNQSASFLSQASGSSPLTYQWQLNGVAISGATTTIYTTNNVPITANGNAYALFVTNLYGTVTSTPAILAVHPPGGINTLKINNATVGTMHLPP